MPVKKVSTEYVLDKDKRQWLLPEKRKKQRIVQVRIVNPKSPFGSRYGSKMWQVDNYLVKGWTVGLICQHVNYDYQLIVNRIRTLIKTNQVRVIHCKGDYIKLAPRKETT